MGRVKYAVILGCSGFREGFRFDMTFEALAELTEGGGDNTNGLWDIDALGIGVTVGSCSALDGTSVDRGGGISESINIYICFTCGGWPPKDCFCAVYIPEPKRTCGCFDFICFLKLDVDPPL